MISKYPLCPDRIRTIPEQFSWVDHRLVRDRHIELLTHEAAALYLFLITVADCQGLSYYGDQSLCRHLTMDEVVLNEARNCLLRARLIAYKKPLYQVLDLSPVTSRRNENLKMSGVAVGSPMSLGEIFRQIAGGAP
jgi:hypothetical protein